MLLSSSMLLVSLFLCCIDTIIAIIIDHIDLDIDTRFGLLGMMIGCVLHLPMCTMLIDLPLGLISIIMSGQFLFVITKPIS